MDLTNGQVFYLGNISTSISMDWSYILAGINSETSNNLESDKLYFYQKNSALSNWQFSVNNNTIYVKKQRLLGY